MNHLNSTIQNGKLLDGSEKLSRSELRTQGAMRSRVPEVVASKLGSGPLFDKFNQRSGPF